MVLLTRLWDGQIPTSTHTCQEDMESVLSCPGPTLELCPEWLMLCHTFKGG